MDYLNCYSYINTNYERWLLRCWSCVDHVVLRYQSCDVDVLNKYYYPHITCPPPTHDSHNKRSREVILICWIVIRCALSCFGCKMLYESIRPRTCHCDALWQIRYRVVSKIPYGLVQFSIVVGSTRISYQCHATEILCFGENHGRIVQCRPPWAPCSWTEALSHKREMARGRIQLAKRTTPWLCSWLKYCQWWLCILLLL